jgi:GNAT superfamily N-acetyltransferase
MSEESPQSAAVCTAPAGTATLGRLSAAQLPQALGLSSALAWPYRIEDWAFAQQLGDCLALELDGQVVGTGGRWNFGDRFATIGMIIVANPSQGRGYGARLVDVLLEGAGGRSVLLIATAEGLEMYRRRGFTSYGEISQYQGIADWPEPAPASTRIRAAAAGDLAAISGLDEAATGMPREQLLASLAQVGSVTVMNDQGVVSGYAVCRRWGRGYVVGPVVAASVADAQLLIHHAASGLRGQFVRVDTAPTTGLGAWLETGGLKRVDTVNAMVRGPAPQPSGPARVFALSNQSLG